MSLQNTLAEIKRLKPISEEDTNSGPPETLNGRRGRKSQAVESLKRLKRDYKAEMLKGAMFIVSVGSGKDEFAKLGTEEFGLFATSAETFYEDLAKRVPPALYLGKTSVSNVFDVLGRHLEDKMMELDINEYNQLIFKAEYAENIPTTQDFTNLIKKSFNKQIGSEIVGIQAVESLTDQAIERNHAAAVTPIVLTTDDTTLALDLIKDLKRITDQVYLLGTGTVEDKLKTLDGAIILEETNKKTVKAALSAMKKSLRK